MVKVKSIVNAVYEFELFKLSIPLFFFIRRRERQSERRTKSVTFYCFRPRVFFLKHIVNCFQHHLHLKTYLWHDKKTKSVDSHAKEVGREEADEGQDVDERVDHRRKSGRVTTFRSPGFGVTSLVSYPELSAPGFLPDITLFL